MAPLANLIDEYKKRLSAGFQDTLSGVSKWYNTPVPTNSTLGKIYSAPGKILNTPYGRVQQQFLQGGTSGNSLGLINAQQVKPITPAEKAANTVGTVVGMFNPYSPGAKLLGGLGKTGMGLSKIDGTGIASKILPMAGAEAAQTLGYAGLSKLGSKLGLNDQTDQFSPLNLAANAGIGLGLRGIAFPGAPTAIKNALFGGAKEIDINLKEVDALRDAWRSASKSEKPKLLEMIRNAADRNLSPELRDKYINSPTQLIKEMQKNLTSKHPQFQPTVLGFAEGAGTNKAQIGSTSEYNVGRIKVKSQKVLREAIDQVKPDFEKVVGGPITHKEVIKSANEFSEDVLKTVGRKTTEELGAAQLRLRQNIAAMADKETVTPELLDALKTDAAFARSTAQLLGQRGIDAVPQTPAGKVKLEYLKAVAKVSDDLDGILKAAEGVNFNDPQQSAAFYRQFIKPNVGDWIDKVRYSSMLSSPNTWINNASSNFQGTGLVAPIEKTITGGLDWMASVVNPNRQRQAFAGEGAEYAKGYYKNLVPAAGKFWDTITGKNISSQQEMFNIPLTQPGTKGRVAENFISFPARVLQATDEFFQTMTEGGAKQSLNYRAANGGKVTDLAGQAYTEGRKRLFNAEFNLPEEGYVLKAVEWLPQKVAEARASNNPIVSNLAKFTFPFVRIPSNILKASVEYSPAGLLTLPGATNKTEQLSKSIMGITMALAGGMLAESGRLTFGEPTSEKQRNEFRAAGLQPYAIKIGDNWVSYSKFHPVVAFNLALASAYKDARESQRLNESDLDVALSTGAKWLNFFADQSYVKNLGDLVSGLKGDSFSLSKMVGNYPQQLIPYRAMMSWVNRLFDPYQRQTDPEAKGLDKQMQLLMLQIPGLAQTLPTRNDSQGTPIENQNRVFNAVTPVGRVTTEDPAAKQRYEKLRSDYLLNRNETAARNMVDNTGKPQTLENKTFYKSGDQVKSFEIPPALKLTGNFTIDTELKKQYKSDVEASAKGVLEAFNTGQITKAQALDYLNKFKSSVSTTSFESASKKQQLASEQSQLNREKKILLTKVATGEISPSEAAPKIAQIQSRVKITSRLTRVKAPKVKKISFKRAKKVRVKKTKIAKIKVKKLKSIKV